MLPLPLQLRLLPFRLQEPELLQTCFGFDPCLVLGNSSALGVVELAVAVVFLLDDTGGLAGDGRAGSRASHGVPYRGERLSTPSTSGEIDREYALDAFAVGNLANREVLVACQPPLAGDADAFIGLNAGTGTFRHA